jgi:quercetin dioxygenase-like cupin family protein
MPFLDFSRMPLEDFRPGIKSAVQFGEQLLLAVMTLEAGLKDPGHVHPFDQCGVILKGSFLLTIAEESRSLGPGEGYFIPAGIFHSWSVPSGPVTVVDVSPKVT